MPIIGYDFCCGIGGATRGLQTAGIRIAKGIDIDDTCRVTYEENCKPAAFVKGDLRDLSIGDFVGDVSLATGDRVLYVACLPCQPFSRAGKLDDADYRSDLPFVFADLVREGKPDFILMENVPGFQKVNGGSLFDKFHRRLLDLKYKCSYEVIDAKDFGIPQKRERFVFLASKRGAPRPPEPTHGPGKLPYSTVRDAISRFPPVAAGKSSSTIRNHMTQALSPLNLERIRATPKNGGSRKTWPRHLVLKCHKNQKIRGHADVYGRMRWDSPGPTLTTRSISLSNGRFGHPEQNRAITVREAAALQGFEDQFEFREPMTTAAMHIGNAVPPPLARVLGSVFIQLAASEQAQLSQEILA